MEYKRKNKGTCSRSTAVVIEDGIVKRVAFEGGCDGNLKGVSALCVGRPVDEVIATLKGIRCGLKSTSCPDQLAQTLEEAKAQL